jgi:hypothetical protein
MVRSITRWGSALTITGLLASACLGPAADPGAEPGAGRGEAERTGTTHDGLAIGDACAINASNGQYFCPIVTAGNSSPRCCTEGSAHVCRDVYDDDLNCGTCGQTCSTSLGQYCSRGHCCPAGQRWSVAAGACRPPLVTGGNTSHYGDLSLAPGFLPDPTSVSVEAGGQQPWNTVPGPFDNGGLMTVCSGWFTSRPTMILRWLSPAPFLRIYAQVPGDAVAGGRNDPVLIVHTPQDLWRCNDNFVPTTTHPSLDFTNVVAGQYDIWLGVHGSDVGQPGHPNPSGVVSITELQGNHP